MLFDNRPWKQNENFDKVILYYRMHKNLTLVQNKHLFFYVAAIYNETLELGIIIFLWL
jgi:hypothetical protein